MPRGTAGNSIYVFANSPPRPSLTPRRYYLASFFSRFQLDTPIWSFYFITQGGCSVVEAGSLYALAFLVLGIIDIPLSFFADRYSRRAVAVAGPLILALSAVVAILFPSYTGLAVSSVMLGIAWAVETGANEAWLYDSLKNTGREQEYGGIISQSMAILFAGRSCAFALSGFAYEYDPRLPYVVTCLSSVVTSAILCGAADAPREYTKKNILPLVYAAARSIWEAKAVRFSLLFLVAGALTADPLWSIMQPMMQLESRGAIATGIVFAVGAASSAIGAQVFSKIVDKMLPYFIIFYLSLSLVCCLLIARSGSFESFLLAFAIVSLAWGAWWPAATTLINHAVPSDRRATAISVLSSSYHLVFGLVTIGATAFFAANGRVVTALTLAGLSAALIVIRLITGKNVEA